MATTDCLNSLILLVLTSADSTERGHHFCRIICSLAQSQFHFLWLYIPLWIFDVTEVSWVINYINLYATV